MSGFLEFLRLRQAQLKQQNKPTEPLKQSIENDLTEVVWDSAKYQVKRVNLDAKGTVTERFNRG